MDISLETKSCEHISFQEASRLMIMQENAVLIPQNICIHKGIFIPKNAKVKDYENAFLKWNMIVTRSDDNSEHLLATSLSSSNRRMLRHNARVLHSRDFTDQLGDVTIINK